MRELLARYVEQHVVHGSRPSLEALCADCPELVESLRRHVRQYERLDETLDVPVAGPTEPPASDHPELPVFEGFRTLERLGSGGGGEVYKLQDLALGRFVAAKVIRKDNPLGSGIDDFLREARAQALFDDPRVARLFEFRATSDPPVLLMEYVEGFELGKIGRSLEYTQRARVMIEVAEAIDRAHRRGLQHRDLKPANVMLDSRLSPKILDFGLSRRDAHLGHGLGTPSYMAPEQLDPGRAIDARTDVYALGVMLYELLAGALPYTGRTTLELLAAIRAGTPRLPMEIEPSVPEPLQAIALKAMERDPGERYASARELASDLERYLEGRPVLTRPLLYQSALEQRVRPHLEQIQEWARVKLIHTHEAVRLTEAYETLEAREEDWIVRSRNLSFSQIALYLGAALLVAGSLLYVYAYFLGSVEGLWKPTLALGLPCVALNLAAHRLHDRQRQAVAVAFYLGAILLLPLFLIVFFQEAGAWSAAAGDPGELFGEGYPSNRQLQLAGLAACLWAGALARRTRTLTLGVCFTALLVVLHLALLADFGLRRWLEELTWDRLAAGLAPLVVVVGLAGAVAERRGWRWLAQPLYVVGIGLVVVVLELVALDGKMLAHLGISTAPFQSADVSHPLLLDTIAAMTLNGLLIYGAGLLLEHRGSPLMRRTAWLAYVVSPFAILHPLSYLVGLGEYSLRYDWVYLGLALAVTLLSHFRQRKSFYYAGLLNTGIALWAITDHQQWFDRPAWAVIVGATGIVVLAVGYALYLRERARRDV